MFVKTGIYLFIRINGVFGQVIDVGMFFLVVGALTAVIGITGGPFFNGSISKYYILYGYKGSIYELIIIIINFGTILAYTNFVAI